MLSVDEFASAWDLNGNLVENLKRSGIQEFFPIQQQVIPALLRQNKFAFITPRDICVSAPTGSGKTLSYAVPVINTLMRETIVRLRTLILLPSRELAKQVNDVFVDLLKDTNLSVCLVTGSKPFEEEQYQLCGNVSKMERTKNPLDLESKNCYDPEVVFYNESLGYSKVDIIICTPGRLLDHLIFTRGFTLKHLRFLVLDEADRLLGNSYHAWVRELLRSHDDSSSNPSNKRLKLSNGSSSFPMSSQELKLPLQRLLFSATLTDNPSALALLGIYNPLYIHSRNTTAATALVAGAGAGAESAKAQEKKRKNEQKREKQENNKEVQQQDDAAEEEEEEEQEAAVEWNEEFELPATLTERKLVVESKDRIIALVAILLGAFNDKEWRDTKWAGLQGVCSASESVCIIFVSSVETSHRLSMMLKIINGQVNEADVSSELRSTLAALDVPKSKSLFQGKVAEMSRLIRPEERDNILEEARTGKVKVIVSSDRLARGMDLPNLHLVINYDAPKLAKSYVHRVGRTARANRAGTCLTLLKKGQLGEFRKLRSQIKHASNTGEFDQVVKSCNFPLSMHDLLLPLYTKSISYLSKYVSS